MIPGQPLIADNLRGLYDRTGLFYESTESRSGFGFRPDGSQASEFTHADHLFPLGVQWGAHVYAFMLSIEGSVEGLIGDARDSHAGVGRQVFLSPASEAVARTLLSIADSGNVGLVAHGTLFGESRGFAYVGNDRFQSDRAGEFRTYQELREAAAGGDALTLMLVPRGSETRIGIDCDSDGILDGNALRLTNAGAHAGAMGEPVDLELEAVHHAGATVRFEAAGLPPGLEISPSGSITGVPTAAGAFEVTVSVRAGPHGFQTATFSWLVREP